MMPDDIITRDSEGQLAVNTVSSTEANVPYNYDDCFTIDTNGRRALRVVGAGGGDSTQVVEKGSGAITQELAGDTVYNCGTVSALTITFPATVTPKYISQVNFTSGTTATALTAPAGMVWLGNDIVQGVFVPVVSKRYAVLFFSDGTNVRGLVQGV